MPTTYKTLGQTTATAASATLIQNFVTDPTFEALGDVTQSNNTNNNVPATINFTSNWRASIENTTNTFRSGISMWGNGAAKAAYAGVNSIWALNTSGGAAQLGFTTAPATSSAGLVLSGSSNFPLALLGSTYAISSSTTYYYGAYLAADGGTTQTVTFRVRWYTSTGTYISTTTNNQSVTVSAGWTRASFSSNSPATAAYATMEIANNLSNAWAFGMDNVWFTYDSTANTTFPTPSVASYTTVVTAPFNKRSETNWSGTANSSTTVTTYAGALTDLYTVPSSTQTVVSTITATNLTTSATSCRISVLPSGQTAATKNFIVFDGTLPANSTDAYTLGITLAAGDKIQVASDIAGVSFSAFGSEIS